MKSKLSIALTALMLLSFLAACANTKSIALVHPEAVTGLPKCTECHTDSWGAMDHQAQDFFLKHKFYAGQQKAACASCHQESFCVECHARKEEIKPSDLHKNRPELSLPHRGDYISQHKIDGRIDPVSCLKCHGRTNNERCVACHK